MASVAPAVSGATAPALVIVDDERICLEASVAACELLGVESEEIAGSTLDSLLAPGMRRRLRHLWHAFSDGGGSAGPLRALSGGELEISVIPDVVPGRHLVVLAGARDPGDGEGSRARRLRLPSAREREVLSLLAAGQTDNQIAARLGVSPATVQTHVRNVKTKLGARTRAQAVAKAIAENLIESP
ncbi:MAG TPA: LuxR C-terminal-related transcriptional regulator [Solirubrobacterales bacterium]